MLVALALVTVVAVTPAAAQDIQADFVFGTTGLDEILDVAVDSSGIYVVGRTTGALVAGTSVVGWDAFVRKFNTNGTVAWTRQIGSTGGSPTPDNNDDVATSVAVDTSGNAWVVGYTDGDLMGEGNDGWTDVWVAKYDTNGNKLWDDLFGAGAAYGIYHSDEAYGVDVAGSGVYVVGSTTGTLGGNAEQRFRKGFMRKYDTAGAIQWTQSFNGGGGGDAAAYGVDAFVYGSPAVGTTTAVYVAGENANGLSVDAYIRRMDVAGNMVWNKTIAGVRFNDSPSWDQGRAVAVDSTGVYVAGGTNEGSIAGQQRFGNWDAWLQKYDADGNALWTRQFGTPQEEKALALAVDRSTGGIIPPPDPGRVYVSGYTGGSLPGQTTFGGFDGFLRKYDPSANLLFTHQLGTSGTDHLNSVARGTPGVHAAGDVNGSAYMIRLEPNFDPVVTANVASASTDEGRQVIVDGTYSDGNSLDDVQLSASIGGVSRNTTAKTWRWFYTPPDGPASQTVTITANDRNGGSATTSFSLTVNNVAPTGTFNAPASVPEGGQITLSLTSPADVTADLASLQYAFDCGDGYGEFSSATGVSCATSDSGPRTAKGKIRDKDGGETEYTGAVTVDNVAPTATFDAPAIVNTGASFDLSLTAPSDPSSADTAAGFAYSFDCGSGYGSPSASSTRECTAGPAGSQAVKGKIADKDAGETEYLASVTVDSGAPPNGTVVVAGGAAYSTTQAVTLTPSATDPAPGSTVAEMAFSNDGVTWSDWEPFAASKLWLLTAGTGSKTVHARFRDGAGNVSADATDGIVLDMSKPTATSPRRSFRPGTTLTASTVPLQISWSGADVGSGVGSYRLQMSIDGGAFADVTLPTPLATSVTRKLVPGKSYRFRARAIDRAGNVSQWVLAAAFDLRAFQETNGAIAYSGSWTLEALGSFAFGGSVKNARAANARAVFTFTGRHVAWVGLRAANRGNAEVLLDGAVVATLDLYSPTTAARRILFARSGLDPAVSHTLTIRVLGTKNPSSSGRIVDVDAFLTA